MIEVLAIVGISGGLLFVILIVGSCVVDVANKFKRWWRRK